MVKKKPIDLEIKTKYNVNSKFIKINNNLPKCPFYMSIVGGKGSGKTLLIANIAHKYKKVFKDGNIFIFTNSFVPTLYKLQETRGCHVFNSIYDAENNNIIDNVLKFQRQEKEQDLDFPHVLLIFDDFITNKALNERRGIFTKLWSMARNFNISLIISSQEYMLIPAPLRKMSDYFIIYKIRNKTEKEQMIKECQNFLDDNQFLKVYNDATKEKYNFLFCMVDEERFLHDFKKELANGKDYEDN